MDLVGEEYFLSFVSVVMLMIFDSKCSKISEDGEEKMLARLGITYGVLRILGFDEERVNQCLKTIGGVDLDTAYEWVIAIQSSASVN